MALNATTLGTLIYTTLTSDAANGFGHGTGTGLTSQQQALLHSMCNAIATAVVSHIQSSAQVVVASVSGVTTGPGTSGPGTGTIL